MQGTPTQIKGFRQAPKPTKGELEQENETLGQRLQSQLQQLQQFYGNLIQQLMRDGRNHTTELNQIAQWLGARTVDDAAQKGDNLIMDYAGMLLNDDGTPATLTIKDGEGNDVQIPDLFDGGNGKLFMLTNLGGGTLIPGFEDQLVGLKATEGKEIEVQFPNEYGVKSLQGKKARFTVYVHAVNRPYPTSPVGALIDENTRIRTEVLQREQAARIAEAKAKADAEAAAQAAASETENKGPGEASTSDGSVETPAPTEEPTQA